MTVRKAAGPEDRDPSGDHPERGDGAGRVRRLIVDAIHSDAGLVDICVRRGRTISFQRCAFFTPSSRVLRRDRRGPELAPIGYYCYILKQESVNYGHDLRFDRT
jgi:hypothetical protein